MQAYLGEVLGYLVKYNRLCDYEHVKVYAKYWAVKVAAVWAQKNILAEYPACMDLKTVWILVEGIMALENLGGDFAGRAREAKDTLKRCMGAVLTPENVTHGKISVGDPDCDYDKLSEIMNMNFYASNIGITFYTDDEIDALFSTIFNSDDTSDSAIYATTHYVYSRSGWGTYQLTSVSDDMHIKVKDHLRRALIRIRKKRYTGDNTPNIEILGEIIECMGILGIDDGPDVVWAFQTIVSNYDPSSGTWKYGKHKTANEPTYQMHHTQVCAISAVLFGDYTLSLPSVAGGSNTTSNPHGLKHAHPGGSGDPNDPKKPRNQLASYAPRTP
jgi:hypothetical protein